MGTSVPSLVLCVLRVMRFWMVWTKRSKLVRLIQCWTRGGSLATTDIWKMKHVESFFDWVPCSVIGSAFGCQGLVWDRKGRYKKKIYSIYLTSQEKQQVRPGNSTTRGCIDLSRWRKWRSTRFLRDAAKLAWWTDIWSFCGKVLSYTVSRARKGAIQTVWYLLRSQILQLHTQYFLRPFMNS